MTGKKTVIGLKTISCDEEVFCLLMLDKPPSHSPTREWRIGDLRHRRLCRGKRIGVTTDYPLHCWRSEETASSYKKIRENKS